MAEYIEREAAVKAAEHAWGEWNLAMAAADGAREINLVYKRQELCKAVASVFASAPAADVAPVVHGHWIEKKSAVGRYFECSNCGAHENKHTAIKGYYCWRCGAKMDGGDDHAAD